jgi:subfamily B ATP-binding cassette protein MsbA
VLVKSIINLLNRFYEINSGSILLTIKILRIILSSLRKQIAVVLQDVFLLNTIFNNITLNNEISREQVLAAAKKNRRAISS